MKHLQKSVITKQVNNEVPVNVSNNKQVNNEVPLNISNSKAGEQWSTFKRR